MGSGAFIKGFEEQVVGMKKGENRDITVRFPDDYQADNLKGKDAVFAIKVNRITEKVYPELTDEFVKAHAGAETVADYKKKVRERLERNMADRGRDETENSILETIAKGAKCVIPDAMIESEIDKLVRDFEMRLMYQGLKLDDYLSYMQMTLDQFRSQFKSQAEPRVLNQLVIDKIVSEKGFTAEESEIEAKIAEQAKSVDKTAEEYKKDMKPRQFEYIASDIVITKMFDFLKANNELYAEGAEPAVKKTAAKSETEKKTAAQKPAAAKKTADAKDGAEKKTTAKKENKE